MELKFGRLHFRSAEPEQDKKYMTLLREEVWYGTRTCRWIVGMVEHMDIVQGNYTFLKLGSCNTYSCEQKKKDNLWSPPVLTKEIHNQPISWILCKSLMYYQLASQKEKIQVNMEERTLQLILQTILNDPCFTWK